MNYSLQDRQELLSLARKTISEYMETGKRPSPTEIPKKFNGKRGAFVTLHKDGVLRGCIGYPLPMKPLYLAITDNALSAAFEDPRFPPLDPEELSQIDIEISVLTVPKKVNDYTDVKVGEDGIIISKHGYRGLLLPQVPVEQGWTLEQYITYGCMKAGLRDDEWKKGVEIEVFQAEVFGEKDG